MSSNFDKMEIKNLNLNNGVNNKNEIKLNIDLISAPNDNFDDIEINLNRIFYLFLVYIHCFKKKTCFQLKNK